MDDDAATSLGSRRVPSRGPAVNSAGVHPNSPAGAPGPGHFAGRQPLGMGDSFSYHLKRGPLDAAEISAAAELNNSYEGARCIYEAYKRAEVYVPTAISNETGRSLHGLLEGIIPALLMMAAVLAATTLFGAAVGATVGALAGGVGAGPGAAGGAKLGFEAGVVILNWLGLGFLVIYVASNLVEVAGLLLRGTRRAWNAGGREAGERNAEVDRAAREIAGAVGVLFRLVLEAIVLYLLAKGTAAAAERVAGLVTKLKESRLGAGFARWVEENWRALVEDPRLNTNSRKRVGSGGDSTVPESRPAPQPAEPRPTKTTAEDAGGLSKSTAGGKVISVEEANAPWVAKGWKPPYGGTSVTEVVLKEETVFVRLHGELNQAGTWMARAEDIKGLSAKQIQDKFALPETPKYISDVHAPQGTRIRVGTAAEQAGWGKGGGTQVELQGYLSPTDFRNRRPLR
jgi:hypothetical protein